MENAKSFTVEANGKETKIGCLLISTAQGNPEPNWAKDYSRTERSRTIEKKCLAVPYGLYRLAHFAAKAAPGANIVVRDPLLDGIENILETIDDLKPAIIGFSPIRLLYGPDRELIERVEAYVRSTGRKPLIALGGVDAAALSNTVTRYIPFVDVVVSGHGELELPRLLSSIYRDPDTGRWIIRPSFRQLTPLTMSVDQFHAFSSYAGEDIPYDRYWRANQELTDDIVPLRLARLHSTSFCPFTCTFCAHQEYVKDINERRLYALSPEELLDIILRFHAMGANGAYFNDDEMFSVRPRVSRFLELVIAAKAEGKLPPNFAFQGQTRVTSVDEELLSLAAVAGFYYIAFGVESFDDATLSAPNLRKQFTAQQAINTLRVSMRYVPITNANLILFHPATSISALRTTMNRTMQLLDESLQTPNRLSINPYLLVEWYPNSPFVDQAALRSYPHESVVVQNANGQHEEHPIRWLPKDDSLRNIVQTLPCGSSRLRKEVECVIGEWLEETFWPTKTVPRTIGIQALAHFEAIERLLGASKVGLSYQPSRIARDLLLQKGT